MKLFIVWSLIGCLIIILNHKRTEDQRTKMFNDTCAKFPHLDARFIMGMVTFSIVVSLLVFVTIWPLVALVRLIKFIRAT